ncbi:MAG: hypothetical protein ABFS46_11080 [Myxococcota bacterium]
MGAETGVQRDLLSDRVVSFLVWKLPALVMVGTAFLSVGNVGRGLVWALCLTVLGGGCVANALRCGRLHCYLTGPLFLLMAGLSLLHGFDLLPLGSAGWMWIGAGTLIGAVALTVLPERVWGKYARSG